MHDNNMEITSDFIEELMTESEDPIDQSDLEKLLEQIEELIASDVQIARDNPCTNCGSIGFNEVESEWVK